MNRRYSILHVMLIVTILTIGLMFLVIGCAQTQPREEKAYEISPKQMVNQITIFTTGSLKELIELSDKDFERAMEILKSDGGVVLHMGAWGIKVEGIKATRTMSSDAKQDTAIKGSLTNP